MPQLPLSWNELFWYFTVFGLALALIQFGFPYLWSMYSSKLPQSWREHVNIVPKFLGMVAILAFFILCYTGFVIIRRVSDTIAFYLVNWNIISAHVSGNASLAITGMSIVLLVLALLVLWRYSARQPNVNTNDSELSETIKELVTTMEERDARLDKLIELLASGRPITCHRNRRHSYAKLKHIYRRGL